MDAKDLRTESALSERNNDGSKYSQSGGIALHCDRNKTYQDIGSNSLGKVDVQNARPCAVIGPDRVVPPPAPSDTYLKKGPTEPWPCMDNAYHTRRPPEYPHKLVNFQNPTRNISPRQTFQENMQRIMVPPSYNSVKISDDNNYVQMPDRSNALPKNIKINVPPEAKFCDVPYTVYPSNDQKNVRNAEMCISSVNPTLTRTAPHGWPPGSVNIRPTRTYGAPELYQYQEYPSCAGPRPVVPRPNRTVPEEPGYVYADPFYHQEGNIRFKPYPSVKDRFPQQRYEYIGNYGNSFHPPPFPTHKYELQKTVPPHPYQPYPPIKYLDRPPEPVMEGYQRNQQGSYNIPYRNQIIHPNYGPVLGNCPQNKIHSYPPDAHIKTLGPNKLPFDNAKAYIEYENGRPKMYPPSESYIVNEMGRVHSMKSQVIMPNYPTINMHNIPPNPYYKKDNQQIKNYEYLQAHFRNMDPNLNHHNPMIRQPPVFSPNTSAISPTDSSTSNDTSQTLGTAQEDCGYVSQSSTASVRSIDSGINRIPNDCLRKYYDNRYGPIIRTAPMMSKSELNSSNNAKEKKNIDVRQFLQMWNEGDEEAEENISKEVIIQTGPKNDNNFIKAHEVINQPNQEQLYVLGLVNVPSEELGKYEHIQKVSKLPENIKGYNHIELLNQFEEAIESSNMSNYKTSTPKDFQMTSKVVPPKQATGVIPPRPLSPLDVEAKISQSVIHKEVGCNFEIKPCSPKMLNVEVATPVQNILTERAIEKVANPVMLKSPRLNGIDENMDCNIRKRKDHRININNEPVRIPSCKMVNTQFSNNIDSIKNSYSLQDLESNSGLCLASLPRLDNDIELNFPEVNQQFINANKGDSSASTPLRDLPSLELLDQSDSHAKDKLNDINSLTQVHDVIKSPCLVDSETEFSKLSKYRKTKTHSSDSKEHQSLVMAVINAARTDSVIIKNPENIKNYEERNAFSPNTELKQVCDMQQVPINLTSQGIITENENNSPISMNPQDATQSKEPNIQTEIAIDFSLNKNNSNSSAECVEIKNAKEVESLTHIVVEKPDSILDDQLSKLPTFSDCAQSIQHTYTNGNKIYENVVDSPTKYNDSEIVTQTTKGEDNLDLVNNPPLEDIFSKDESPLSASEVKEVNNAEDNMSHAPNGNATNDKNVLLPIEFVTPTAETIQTDNTSFLMDIDKQSDLITNDSYDIDLKKDNISRKNIPNDVVTNIEEIEADLEDCPDIASTKTTIDPDLHIDVPEGNNNQISVETEVENPGTVNCNNFNSTKKDTTNTLNPNTFQSNDMKQVTYGNSNLTSINNVDSHSHCANPKDINEQVDEPSLLCNNMVTINPNVDQSSITKHNLNSHLSSPKSIPIPSPQSYQPDLQESISNLESQPSNLMDINNKEDDQLEVIETNAKCINDHQNEVTDKVSHSSPCFNEIIADISKDYQIDAASRQSVCNSNLPSPRNSSIHETIESSSTNYHTNSLLEEFTSNQIGLCSTTQKTHHQKILEEQVVEMSQKSNTKESPVNETNKYINVNLLERRYLSYGSKEMYSPWIQKLVLFCEGNINNIKHEGVKVRKNCVSMETETDIPSDFDVCYKENNDNIPNLNVYCEDDSIILAMQNKNSETRSHDDISVTKEYSTVDITNYYKEDCKITEDEEGPISKSDTVFNKITVQENDAIKHTHTQDSENKNTENSTSLSNDIDNDYEKLDVLSNVEQVSCCLSPDVQERWESNCSDKAHEEWDKHSSYDGIPEQWDTQFNCSIDVPHHLDKQSTCLDDVAKQLQEPSNQNDLISNQNDMELESNNEIERSDQQSDCSYDEAESWEKQSNCSDIIPEQFDDEQSKSNHVVSEQQDMPSDCSNKTPDQLDKESNCTDEIFAHAHEQAECSDAEKSSAIIENDEVFGTKLQTSESTFLNKKRQSLKRSLSDSALNVHNSNNDNMHQENEDNVQFIWPFKRRKMIHNDILAEDLCNIIQNNRRNSISAIYNEENVSFCILIDNSCIITEEENEEQEKICYTEISEECLAEIDNECPKEDESIETMTDVTSDISNLQQENDCHYTDSFITQNGNEKVEESWVEDVACVETVISDDIAADIEISGPLSPKDDVLSDNDESGVFSSSEHTDKVKYIYGDKMCNDDAQFVETLYNTPQMDVNKTLVQRETLVSGEYYDNDSLERILSESNDQDLSPYVSEYIEPVFSPGIVHVKETAENKENVVEMISPLQNDVVAPLDGVDRSIDKTNHENEKLCDLFDETQDDTVHSCESSVDNVFTYKENDENTNYTSSSPEVSSTTSEEKKSAILLKITNYQGSRVSQVSDINRDIQRSSCKFTEDKDYIQSQSHFSSHRPLLTKAAQKYIPPLKESIRDLKVKLSLPQHSLMKLKQLKISKDETKVSKQNINIPRISKKPKPKFEDVLKSIDEIQIKMHKEKTKRSKKSIPKVVIKKNENGSHYASTSNKEEFNPDLTGRKWQPWVFIEKNHFIDKMAMKKKTKAIYSHRKRTYVLAEKFQKYKSVNSAKFVISPPISDCPSTGLKYTIRLKHNY